MTSTAARLAALATLLFHAGALGAAPLEGTALYRERARDCRTLDLKTWSHPTRKVMETEQVGIERVELCNGGVYPVFTVSLPGDPIVGASDRYYNKLHARMAEANGWHSYAFVDPRRGVVIYADITGKREISLSYDEFDAPQAK